MYASARNCDALIKVITALNELEADAIFACSEKGMSIQAMDEVWVMSVFFKAEGFECYVCDKTCEFGIDVEEFTNSLRYINPEYSVEWSYKDQSNVLDFVFQSHDEECVSSISITLSQLKKDRFITPEMDYKICVQMPSATFKRISSDLSSIGPAVSIKVTMQEISFAVSGLAGSGKMSVKHYNGSEKCQNEDLGEIETKKNFFLEESRRTIIKSKVEELCQTFLIRYLKKFSMATSLAKTVKLRLSPDLPLMIEYEIFDSRMLGYIRYYLSQHFFANWTKSSKPF